MTDLTPFIRGGTVGRIVKNVQRAHLTSLELAGGGWTIEFSRYSLAQQRRIAVPAQDGVLIEFANTQRRESQSESAEAAAMLGSLSRVVPFDVLPDDLFNYWADPAEDDPDLAQVGKVLVVYPEELGVKRATFTLAIEG